MDVLFDYRPALRTRSGVGEYVHELVAALLRRGNPDDRIHLFSSSWKDRLVLTPDLAAAAECARTQEDTRAERRVDIRAEARALDTRSEGRRVDTRSEGRRVDTRGAGLQSCSLTVHDHRVPVRVLNWLWHRAGRPAAERLVGHRLDAVHAAHPLLIPSRRAAGLITVHDLDFLDHPERTSAEVRRDYAERAGAHARRADGVIAVSEVTRRQVIERLGVDPSRITVARAGVPRWVQAERAAPRPQDGYILFLGTLEPRKNVGVLLDGYERLLERRTGVPRLRLAGRATPAADPWLDRVARAPLAGHVDVSGYVDDRDRRAVFEGAVMLVLPSWNEGFGLPVLEALAIGVPVVVSDRGALPEVAGDAALYVDPADPESVADAIAQVLDDPAAADARVRLGRARVASWSWDDAADRVWQAYRDAIAWRAGRADRD